MDLSRLVDGVVHLLQVKWGIDLASEHERYLTEQVFKQPVIVFDYPKDIKVLRCTRTSLQFMYRSPCQLLSCHATQHYDQCGAWQS